jgi:SAM-dependent methyltransferase
MNVIVERRTAVDARSDRIGATEIALEHDGCRVVAAPPDHPHQYRMALLFLLLQLAFALLFFYLCLAFLTGAPFVPSTGSVSKRMVDLAGIRTGDVVIDMGSGDGRLLLLSAARGATAIGIEINPYLVIFATIRGWLSPWRKRISVRWGDLWRTDVRTADVVYIYLLPWKMDRLKRRLLGQLKPGARIVSNSFIFPDWKPTAADETNHVYVFTVPEASSAARRPVRTQTARMTR